MPIEKIERKYTNDGSCYWIKENKFEKSICLSRYKSIVNLYFIGEKDKK